LLLLQAAAVTHALLALSEPVLAGSYLGGTAGATNVHEPLGHEDMAMMAAFETV
jgi:hypothetical protein